MKSRVTAGEWHSDYCNAQRTSRFRFPGAKEGRLIAKVNTEQMVRILVDSQNRIYGIGNEVALVLSESGRILSKFRHYIRGRWLKRLQGLVNGVAMGSDGRIFVAARGRLAALSPSGSILWKFDVQPDWRDFHAPLVDAVGNVYVSCESGHRGLGRATLFCLSPDGNLQWEFRVKSDADAVTAPAMDHMGNVYILDRYAICATIYCLDALGNVKFKIELPEGSVNEMPVVDAVFGRIYFVSYGCSDKKGNYGPDHLCCIDMSGQRMWKVEIDQPRGTHGFHYPTSDFIALAKDGQVLVLREPITIGYPALWVFGLHGEVLHHREIGEVSRPTVDVNGTIYVTHGGKNCGLLALDSSLQILWRTTFYEAPEGYRISAGQPVIVRPGRIAVSTRMYTNLPPDMDSKSLEKAFHGFGFLCLID